VLTIVRLNEKRYAAPRINLGELFDQIPTPMAYFDSNNCLGACNLSFRNAFPVVVESEFLTRAGYGLVRAKRSALPAHSQSTGYDSARYAFDAPNVRVLQMAVSC
jgi:hypothetical protein